MSLSTAREATSSSGSMRRLPEVYASMARRASSPAETPSRRLISRSFLTLLRGTRYCWRMRSSAFADMPLLCLEFHEPQSNYQGIIHIHNSIHNLPQITETQKSARQIAFRREARLEEDVVDGDAKPRDSGERRGLTTGAPVGDFR